MKRRSFAGRCMLLALARCRHMKGRLSGGFDRCNIFRLDEVFGRHRPPEIESQTMLRT
jgi:hypothetical protein